MVGFGVGIMVGFVTGWWVGNSCSCFLLGSGVAKCFCCFFWFSLLVWVGIVFGVGIGTGFGTGFCTGLVILLVASGLVLACGFALLVGLVK